MVPQIEKEPIPTQVCVLFLVHDEDDRIIGFLEPHRFEISQFKGRLNPNYPEEYLLLAEHAINVAQVVKQSTRELSFYKVISQDEVNGLERIPFTEENTSKAIEKTVEIWNQTLDLQSLDPQTIILDTKDEITTRESVCFSTEGL